MANGHSNTTRRILAIHALLAGVRLPAQDPTGADIEALLQTQVIVASKRHENWTEAPAILSVLRRSDLEKLPGRTLGQVLSSLASLSFLSPDVWREQSVVIRGQERTPYNNHLLVLLDGRPLRDPIAGGIHAPIWTQFPLSALERIELIRGPGSVLYGSCAYAGVLNLITRTGPQGAPLGEIRLVSGSLGTRVVEATAAFRQQDLEWFFSGIRQQSDGPRYSFVDYRHTPGAAAFSRRGATGLAKVGWKGLRFEAYQATTDPYTLDGSEFWNDAYRNQNTLTHLNLGWEGWLRETLLVSVDATSNRTEWDGGRVDQPLRTAARSAQGEASLRWNPLAGLSLLGGATWEYSTWGGDRLRSGHQHGQTFYAQLEYQRGGLKLVGGGQVNRLKQIPSHVSPRLAVIWSFRPAWGLKVMHATAFRKAYPLEIDFNLPVFRGNPALTPELVTTQEAQVFYQDPQIRLACAVYDSRERDIITRRRYEDLSIPPPQPPFYFRYENGGRWQSRGLELEGQFRLGESVLGYLAAAWGWDRSDSGVEHASLHPARSLKAGLTWTQSALQVGLHASAISRPYPTTLVNPDSSPVNPWPTGHANLNLKASWTLVEAAQGRLRLELEASNLLNQELRYPDYPNKQVNSLLPLGGGRSAWLALRWTY